mmetsp:Transcript_20899/g.45353  ORF Transcript_20899/g.45353 Transcript_20899/m.45353 type:complete len:341 (-) Transcript_20899:99-1121(-)
MAVGSEVNAAAHHRRLCSGEQSDRLRQHIKYDEKRQRRKRRKNEERKRKESFRQSKKDPSESRHDVYITTRASSREDLQLELVVMRRRERELRQRLINIQIQKEYELKEIRQPIQKMRKETFGLTLVEKELYFQTKEIEELNKEHSALGAQNERLALNIHNMRINSRRLKDFARGNRDDYKMLQMHHDRLQSDNLKLRAQEEQMKNKVEKLKKDIREGTAYIHAENRLKQTLRTHARSALHRTSEGDDKELFQTLNESFKLVERYEAVPDTPLSFPSDRDEPSKTKKWGSREKKSRSKSSDDTIIFKTKRDGQRKKEKLSRKRRSHRKPESRLQDSWKSL